MQKEDLTKEISTHIDTLRDWGRQYNQLVDSLGKTMNADTSFSVIENARDVLASMSETRTSIDKIRSALRARAIARLKGK